MRHERRKRIAKKRRAKANRVAVRVFREEFARRAHEEGLNLAIQWSQANAWVPWD